MLQQADVTAENMAPGTIERLGLGYDEVKKLNPGIIYCQIKGFGDGSPYAKGLAFDMIAQAAGGTISVTGEPDRPPVKPGLSFGDTGTGMLMAATILGALHERNRTGQGRRLQVAMQDAMLHYMRTCFATMARTGRAAPRNGAKSGGGNNAPSGLYPCAPGGPNDYVYITTSRANPEHWSRLMTVIGQAELIDDPRFATGNDRVAHEQELDAIISAWTRQHTKQEAMAADQWRWGPGRRSLRHDGIAERAELRGARHHAGDAAPERRLQDAELAGAGRRQAAPAEAVAALGPAQRRGAARLARHRRR